MKEFFQSKKIKCLLAILLGVVILLVVFRMGELVGYRKALFSYRWGENYEHLFGGPRGQMYSRFFEGGDFMSAHGATGTVLKVDTGAIIVRGSDNIEKTVLVATTTVLREKAKTIGLADIEPDETLVVIGEPSPTGQIVAKFIRVFESQ